MTGSSAGIGEAIARRLAAEGAAVIVHGRRAHAVSAVTEAISADGGQAGGLTADLADPADCARLISGSLAGKGETVIEPGRPSNAGFPGAAIAPAHNAPADWPRWSRSAGGVGPVIERPDVAARE